MRIISILSSLNVLLFLILFFLRVFSIANIPWIWVFSPIWVIPTVLTSIAFILLITACIIILIENVWI